jgi:hypothetical protein
VRVESGRSDLQSSAVNPLATEGYCSDENSDWGGDDGSVGSVDHLTEDINTLTINNPSGYMGRGSDFSWLKLLHDKLDIDPWAGVHEAGAGGELGEGNPGHQIDTDMLG